jgi:hypothetical protein
MHTKIDSIKSNNKQKCFRFIYPYNNMINNCIMFISFYFIFKVDQKKIHPERFVKQSGCNFLQLEVG